MRNSTAPCTHDDAFHAFHGSAHRTHSAVASNVDAVNQSTTSPHRRCTALGISAATQSHLASGRPAGDHQTRGGQGLAGTLFCSRPVDSGPRRLRASTSWTCSTPSSVEELFGKGSHRLAGVRPPIRPALQQAKAALDVARQDAGGVVDLTEDYEEPLSGAGGGSSVDKVTLSIEQLTTSVRSCCFGSRHRACSQTTSGRQPRRQRRGNAKRVGFCSCCLAFWQGWSVETNGCADLKPIALGGSAILAVKWSHSITFEADFLSEWGARDIARHLCLEVQLNNISSLVSSTCPSRSSSS